MTDYNDLAIDDALPIEPAKAAKILLYVIAGLFFLGLVWAATAQLDRVTRGQGRVVPSNQLQEVQYLEGGIVKEILVKAGEEVTAGQILVRLDPTQFNAEFAKGREGYNLAAARVRRLDAEIAQKELDFPKELLSAAPDVTADERSLYEARMAELNASLDVENAKLNQRKQSLEEAKVARDYAQQSLDLASQELEMMKPLVAKGIEPQIELLRTRQRESTARGELHRAEIAVERAAAEVAEAESEIVRIKKTFSANVADELAKAKAEYVELSGGLPAIRDKVDRTEVRSPIDGVVNRVLVSTIGGVVQPGETIVEIVPSEDSLLVEARIKQADIGFLSIGQPAKVKVSAYDSAIYGSLDGKIESISADSIEDEKSGDRYYLIKVRTDKNAIKSKRGELQILPGMGAEVDILNGKRTVLAYLLNPVSKLSDNALRER
ncbi:MAG: HlyD family type I secretion periplasmic adaptor subunit [Pseudomonadota bacterium]|nr:HlyD family type I secretion periplasmic adaptor subunit [Pseudomonadota bacterium]